ncbi:MAG: TIGR03936 family radical SAM-associated protein [Anaerolineae bacterium]|nr:TIGR03936 family radical SAM-associated protein [Anaerolineae bacterium]
MQANYVQRLRLRFSKVGPARYIGHLDLARALERALNRARLPVAYTQGFNRRPRLQFAAALPLGFTSEAELADVWLTERVKAEEAQRQLMSRMAPGIVIYEMWEVPLDAPAMQAATVETTYVAVLPEEIDSNAVGERVAALLATESVPRERRGKRYDLRPLVYDLTLDEEPQAGWQLTLRLALEPGATGRPDEVLDAIGLDPLDLHVHRIAIVLEDGAA